MAKGEWGRRHESSHGEHGWFAATEPSYGFLLKSSAVKEWSDSMSSQAIMKARLYDLRLYLDYAGLGPDEVLKVTEDEMTAPLLALIREYREQGKESRGKRIYYSVRSFLEFHDKPLNLKRQTKAQLMRTSSKQIQKQYIPSKTDIYRMADSAVNLRDRAIIMCLWSSGVRGGCLCRWRYEMVKDQLFGNGEPSYPLKIIVTSKEDRKISHYGLNYYVTFVVHEAAESLKTYLEWRMKEGWKPQNEDLVFVTHGNVSKDQPLTPQLLNEVVKFVAERAGLNPSSIWPHVMRKAFRKTLYMAGINEDISEALMGHRLPGSRSNYFDYHDADMVMKEYLSADWSRTSSSRFAKLEADLNKAQQNGVHKETKLQEFGQQLEQLNIAFESEKADNKQLRERLAKIEELMRTMVLFSGP